MDLRYNYNLDKRARRLTWIFMITVCTIIAVLIYFFMGHGAYLPAWFLTIAIALGALYVLSIPRFVKLTDNYLEIHCIVELTKINITDIKTIKRLDDKTLKHTIPILGSYGFWGYYGYFFNLEEWEMIKIYASAWKNFVEIEDIYEQKYIINIDDNPEGFIEEVLYRRQKELSNDQSDIPTNEGN